MNCNFLESSLKLYWAHLHEEEERVFRNIRDKGTLNCRNIVNKYKSLCHVNLSI